MELNQCVWIAKMKILHLKVHVKADLEGQLLLTTSYA